MEPRDPGPSPILVAFSPSVSGREPVEFGIAASRLTGAPLVVLTVRPGGPVVHQFVGAVDDSAGGDARAIENVRRDLHRRGITADVRIREERTVGGGLTKAMEELKPQMVVLGATHRRVVGSALLGSTVERVIHAAPCPVAVVPPGYRRPEDGMHLIGAAFVPTPEGRDALGAAAALARTGAARLRAILVLDAKHIPLQSPDLLAQQHGETDPDEAPAAQRLLLAQAQLREAVTAAAEDVDTETDVLFGDAADALVAAAEQVDMLVMGSRRRGPRRAVIFGSVSRRVAERATCPVLILPRDASEATEMLISHAETHGMR